MHRLALLSLPFMVSFADAQGVKKDDPLAIKLIAKRTTYPWQASPKDPSKKPPAGPAAVAFVVELTNQSKETLDVVGDAHPRWTVVGPKKEKAPVQEFDRFFGPPLPTTWRIEPGDTLRLGVHELSYVAGLVRRGYAWPGPGKYVLEAELVFGVAPPPKGAPAFEAPGAPDELKLGQVRFTAAAIEIEVVEADPADYWAKAAADADADVRAAALVAIKNIGKPAKAATPAIARLLKDADTATKLLGLEALASMGSDAKDATAEVMALTREIEVPLRIGAARTLARIAVGDAKARLVAVSLLNDPAADVRRAVAVDLNRWLDKSRKAEPELKRTLLRALKNDPDTATRTYLIRALGYVAEPDVLAAILPDVRDGATPVWTSAIASIGQVCMWLPKEEDRPEVRRAVKVLMAALEDKEKRDHAAFALQYMAPESAEAVPVLLAMLDDPESVRKTFSHPRLNIVRALGAMGPGAATAAPRLAQCLKDDEEGLRGEAAHALGRMGEAARKYIPDLVEALRGPDRVRGVAVEAISNLGTVANDAVRPLLNLLNSAASREARVAAAITLTRIGMKGRKDAVPILVACLDDSEAPVAEWSADVLAQIGPDAAAALPALRKLQKSTRIGRPSAIENAIKVIEGR